MDKEKSQTSRERNLLKEFFNEFFDMEYGLWQTFITLFTLPEQVVKAYLDENARRYYPPIKYVMLSVTVMTFIFFGAFDIEKMTAEQINNPAQQYEFNAEQQKVLDAITDNYTKVMVLVGKKYVSITALVIWLPSLAIVSFWFFKKRYKKFMHHILFVAYFFGQATFINTILILPLYFTNLGNGYIMLTDFLKNFYVAWAFSKLMYDKTRASIVRSIAVAFLSSILYTVLLVLIVMAATIFLSYRQGVLG